MSKPGNVWRRIHGKITKKPTNFSWVINNNLAGSGIPTSQDEFNWILSNNIKCVITMTEQALPGSWTKDIKYLHLPTPDLSPPTLDDINQAVQFIDENIRAKRPVMVHCAAGLGRAGTILTCYLIAHKGYSAKDAIEKIRNERPGSIQSESQKEAIYHYEKAV